MRKKIILLLTSIVTLSSCHWQTDIVVVKNTTSDSLLVAKQPYNKMTDSILYYERFDENFVGNEPYNITLPNRVPNQAPANEKIFIYFFNLDSVNKFQKLRQINGIFKHSLLKQVVIKLNKVKGTLDTIYIGKKL